jgi:hypothetical protein
MICVLGHLLGEREGGGQAGVAGRALFHALQGGERLGDVEHLALA